jgi:hypothetical protein
LTPREFDVSRDTASQLRRLTTPKHRRDSRNLMAGSSKAEQMFLCDDKEEEEIRQKVFLNLFNI